MKVSNWVRESVEDARELVGSGIEGANAGWKQAQESARAGEFRQVAQQSWKAALAGACLGAATAYLAADRRRGRSAVVGGVVGGALGLSTGVAWQRRSALASAATSAMKSVGEVRDQHWLEKNPIDYA